ncbi:hypothetical protein GGTG_09494 [Gaeumannomyces tritici R3-111a-1]|uniref:Uncharacterized protein n=1 Tax=Gaeumannomyces tritici (strain R3-111a-1) TaxID=644352 RepID=J3P7K2_GAET3|nr:hypothetical protein GGTG_09494 [Gaeumannomyces tritici R3-111a-1]EJT72634.1 hypothetical protein GGTG_09494 [Gaeumannomyces tritici R3-111a-1]
MPTLTEARLLGALAAGRHGQEAAPPWIKHLQLWGQHQQSTSNHGSGAAKDVLCQCRIGQTGLIVARLPEKSAHATCPEPASQTPRNKARPASY